MVIRILVLFQFGLTDIIKTAAQIPVSQSKRRDRRNRKRKKVWVNEGEKKIGLYFARWNRERVVHSLDAELGRDKCYYKFRTNELQRQRF